jgi:DNA topoisomerase-3
LIGTIRNKLLTSAELTGQWEKQLKEIEKGKYNAGSFVKNMKKMVDHLVYEVRMEQSYDKISLTTEETTTKEVIQKATAVTEIIGMSCPKCKQGSFLKGKTGYGCSDYKNGCTLLLPFSFKGKKISDKQYLRLLEKGCTVNLKGFKTSAGSKEGLIRFDSAFELLLEEKKILKVEKKKGAQNSIPCPICAKGTVIKGKTAYGCSAYKAGCNFRYTFDAIRKKAEKKPLTVELVTALIKESAVG